PLLPSFPTRRSSDLITAMLLAYDPARRLARLQVGLEKALVNARMIYEVLDIEPRQRDVPHAMELKAGPGEIRFEDIYFTYNETRSEEHTSELQSREN